MNFNCVFKLCFKNDDYQHVNHFKISRIKRVAQIMKHIHI